MPRVAIISDIETVPPAPEHCFWKQTTIITSAISTFEKTVADWARAFGLPLEIEAPQALRYGEAWAPLMVNLRLALMSDIRIVCGPAQSQRLKHFVDYCEKSNKVVHFVDPWLPIEVLWPILGRGHV